MSKQLSLAAAASILAMSALALFAPGSAHPSDAFARASGPNLAVPALSAALPFGN